MYIIYRYINLILKLLEKIYKSKNLKLKLFLSCKKFSQNYLYSHIHLNTMYTN